MGVLTETGSLIKDIEIKSMGNNFNNAQCGKALIKCNSGFVVGDIYGGLLGKVSHLRQYTAVYFVLSNVKLMPGTSSPYLSGRIVEMIPLTIDNSSVVTESNIVKTQSTSQFAASKPLVNTRSPHTDFNYNLNAETAIPEENTVSEEDVPW